MARAEIEVGINGAAFSKGLDELRSKADSFNKAMDGSSSGFFSLEGEKRVERNLGSMVQGLASATNGAEALAVALDRIENVFQSSIGASVAVAGITALVSLMEKAKRGWEEYGKAAVEAMRNISEATVDGRFEAANAAIQTRMEQLRKERAETNSVTGTIGTDLNRLFRGGPDAITKAKEQNRELERLKNQLAENIAASSKSVQEKANQEEIDAALEVVDRVNKAYEDGIEERKKAREEADKQDQNFAEQQFREYEGWLAKKTAAEDKARKDKEQKDKEADARAQEVAERNFQQFQELEKKKDELGRAVAERNKDYRENIIGEELKTPGQRNTERNDARAAASAESRAISRLAQKAQDKQNSDFRNPRMSDAERDALADKLRKQRVEDKKPQMEQDISEINASIKALKTKIGVA